VIQHGSSGSASAAPHRRRCEQTPVGSATHESQPPTRRAARAITATGNTAWCALMNSKTRTGSCRSRVRTRQPLERGMSRSSRSCRICQRRRCSPQRGRRGSKRWPSATPAVAGGQSHRAAHRHHLGDVIVGGDDLYGDGVNIRRADRSPGRCRRSCSSLIRRPHRAGFPDG